MEHTEKHWREVTKENKTKSGQSTDEAYQSTWPFIDKMRFVGQAKKTAKSSPTLMLQEGGNNTDEEDMGSNSSVNLLNLDT